MNKLLYLPVEQQFQHNAEIYSENIALIKGDLSHDYLSYSYQTLNQKANKYARYLQFCHIEPGTPVVVFMTDPLEVVPAMIGLFRMGAIFVPLNPTDPTQRISDILREIRPKCMLVDNENHTRFLNLTEINVVPLVTLQVNSAEFSKEFNEFSDESLPEFNAGLDDVCYVYYSSGTTGKPKGITGTRRGISHFIRWEIQTLGLTSDARVSQWTQPFYDAFLRDVFVPLCCGGTIVAPNSIETVLTTESLISWMNISGVNVVHTIPTIFHRIIQEAISSTDFPKLRYVLLAGERVMPNDVKRCLEIFAERIQLLNLYGPTETVMTKLYYFIKPGDECRRSIPIGRPMPEVEVELLDNQGAPVEKGDIGEIAISPDFYLPGYFGQPELTKAAYVSSPHFKRGIVYKTGDYGRLLDSGDFEFLGRKDHQVKINGIRVELSEIENHLSSHPEVQECVVQLLQDDGKHMLVAWLSGNLNEAGVGKEMYEYLKDKSPTYLLPNHYVLVDKLPQLPNGKVNYKALPKFDLQSLRTKPQSFFEDIFEQAYELTEITLAHIWEQALNRTQIRLNDNFFQLGGDSLMVFTVIAEIRKQLNHEVPLSVFLKNPTIAQLAKIVREKSNVDSSIIVPLYTKGTATPFWCIHPPGGNVLTYARLAYRIGEQYPFYAIQHPVLIGKHSNTTLEATASDYIDQLLSVQPHGPFILAGWSMGGVIAFEMARQLTAQGHKVSLVALIDSEWPYSIDTDITDEVERKKQVEWNAFSSLVRFLGQGFNIEAVEKKLVYSERVLRGTLNFAAQQFMGVTFTHAQCKRFPRELLLIVDQLLEKLLGHNRLLRWIPFWLLSRLTPQRQTDLILNILRWLKQTPTGFNPANFNAFMSAFRHQLQTVCAYRPQPIDVKLALFITGSISQENLRGWQTCSTSAVQVYPTSGNHFTLLTEPNVGELAKHIVQVINHINT